jgi:tRNA G18 (ribose-2'-O)-methylase SpoU
VRANVCHARVTCDAHNVSPCCSCRRQSTGRVDQKVWQPQLVPPPLLQHVAVVLVGTKRPSSVGAVARACSCFEALDMRLVAPRCDPLSR